VNDLRLALRSLVLRPGFSAVVIATLAIGVGINTAIFSVVDGVLLKPLPYAQPERIVTLWEANPQLDVAQDRVAAATFTDWAERSRSFDALGAYGFEDFTFEESGEPEQIPGARLSPEVFDVIGVRPTLGRAFEPAEAQPGNDRVAILGHGFWLTRYSGDPGVLGQSVTLDGEPYTVVGVMPERFQFPPGASRVSVWTPLAINARVFTVRAMRVYYVVARLAPGVSVTQARTEMDGIARDIADENPDSNRGWGVDVTPALDQVVGDVRLLLGVLGASAGLVLLIACVNISNLLLVRSLGQSREFALRATLGAGGWRLLWRSLAQSLVLAGAGGAAGLGLGVTGVVVLKRLLPPDLPRIDQVAVDLRVLAFAAVVSLLAGAFFGLYPAFRAMRPDLAEVLQEGGRGGSGGRRARGALDALVAGQVALALLLLLGAGVTVRSMANLLSVDPGFRVQGVLSVALSLPENAYPGQQEQIVTMNEIVDRVSSLPGVRVASSVSTLPMSPLGIDFDLPIEVEGRDAPSAGERPRAGYRAVMPGYFEALDVPLVRGRFLDRFDREEGRPVMVLNETAERLLFPGEDAVGRILGVPMAGRIEVVGVVGDVLHGGLDAQVVPELFVSHMNFPLRDTHLIVRQRGHGYGGPAGPTGHPLRRSPAPHRGDGYHGGVDRGLAGAPPLQHGAPAGLRRLCPGARGHRDLRRGVVLGGATLQRDRHSDGARIRRGTDVPVGGRPDAGLRSSRRRGRSGDRDRGESRGPWAALRRGAPRPHDPGGGRGRPGLAAGLPAWRALRIDPARALDSQ
jgi:predicted permease